MTRPLTDRERILQLEAKNAELTEELEAYRANADHEVRWAREQGRIHRVAKALRKAMVKTPRAPGLARVLLDLLAHPGMVRTKAQIYYAYQPTAQELPDDLKLVDVVICHLRKATGFAAIETVWGHGWLVPFEQAAALRFRFEGDA